MQNLVDEACKRVQIGGSTKMESFYLYSLSNFVIVAFKYLGSNVSMRRKNSIFLKILWQM